MAAEFTPPGVMGQKSPKQEASWEGVGGSCIFRRLCLSLDKVSLCSCCLFRCFQFKIVFMSLMGYRSLCHVFKISKEFRVEQLEGIGTAKKSPGFTLLSFSHLSQAPSMWEF
jgi:hypothetical protein